MMNCEVRGPITFNANLYDEHPAFQFSTSEWEVSSSDLTELNQLISNLKKSCFYLKKNKLDDLINDSIKKINAIFSQLKSQTEDNMEDIFLEELNKECIRLFREEVEFESGRSVYWSQINLNANVNTQVNKLLTDRFHVGVISSNVVQQLLELGAKSLSQFNNNVCLGRLTREDLSINSGRSIRKMREILQHEFKRLGILDSLSAYMGQRIDVDGLAFELSVPSSGWWKNSFEQLIRPPHTLYAHFDESIIFPKAIVYLSDVGELNGPTSCYPGSYELIELNPLQELIGRVIGVVGERSGSPLKSYYAKQYHQSVTSRNFRKHLMRLPKNLRFNSHFGWDILPDSLIEKDLLGREYRLLGSAGTFICFDGGRLLHRGGLIEKGERIALQVIFSKPTLKKIIKNKISRIFE